MSINMEIEIAGAEELAQALNRLDSEIQAKVQQRLTEWAETVKTEASRLVPVRTGYLRSTIFARTQQWHAEVGAEAAYAATVEFGTTHMSARPFIQPALQQHLPELERVLLEALDSAQTEASV
jgi:HK97 gp10 family phage protein